MRTVSVAFAAIWGLEIFISRADFLGAAHDPLGIFGWLTLMPSRVLHGEAWRLVSYALLHDPRGVVSLVFTVLTLWFFGGDLEKRWGLAYLGLVALASTVVGALLVTLVGAVYLPFSFATVLGPSALSTALAVAWGRSVGERKMSFFGLAELSGRQFVYVIVALLLVGLVMSRDGAAVASLGGIVAVMFHGPRSGRKGRVSKAERKLRAVPKNDLMN